MAKATILQNKDASALPDNWRSLPSLTSRQTQEALQLSRTTVHKLVKGNVLHPFTVCGSVRFLTDEVLGVITNSLPASLRKKTDPAIAQAADAARKAKREIRRSVGVRSAPLAKRSNAAFSLHAESVL